MYSTLSKQFLQITIAFLICTGAAWGQTYGIIGAQSGSINDNLTMTTARTAWIIQSGKQYTASAGDTVIWVGGQSLADDITPPHRSGCSVVERAEPPKREPGVKERLEKLAGECKYYDKGSWIADKLVDIIKGMD